MGCMAKVHAGVDVLHWRPRTTLEDWGSGYWWSFQTFPSVSPLPLSFHPPLPISLLSVCPSCLAPSTFCLLSLPSVSCPLSVSLCLFPSVSPMSHPLCIFSMSLLVVSLSLSLSPSLHILSSFLTDWFQQKRYKICIHKDTEFPWKLSCILGRGFVMRPN
jgi:hypothetical protein